MNEIRAYTYDNLNQLTTSVFKNVITETVTVEGEADEEGNPTTTTQTVTREEDALTTSYTYDIVGNRIRKVENGAATDYTYNSLNQLTGEKGTGTNLTYTYDGNGNQTGITGTSGGSSVNKAFTYTPEDMLETYTEGSVSQTNLYNGEGQRVQKKEGSDVTNYFYQFGSVLYTTDANGSLKAFNLLNRIDAFGTSRKSETAEDYYLYTDDLRGSTVNVLDSNAGRVVSYWYNDFGEVTESKSSGFTGFDNELQYTGAVHDASTGLLYLNARFYDPQTGRFISRDTYRGERDKASTWHLYLYCANNPVNYVDPSGHLGIALPAIATITGQVLVNALKEAVIIAVSAYTKIGFYKIKQAFSITTADKTRIANLATSLKTSTKKSWKDKKSGKKHNHHIIPKTARKAATARNIWTIRHNMNINSSRNLVRIKMNLHKHLHTNDYYYGVDALIRASQYTISNLQNEFPRLISDSKVKKMQRSTCLNSVAILKKVIQAANLAAKG